MGNSDIDDSLQRLDKLTQEEARKTLLEQLKATRCIDEKLADIDNKAQSIGDDVKDNSSKVRDVGAKLDLVNRS